MIESSYISSDYPVEKHIAQNRIRALKSYTKGGFVVVLKRTPLFRSFKLYGQANKRIWWMPRQLEAMKDVVVCDKPGGGDERPLYPGISEWGNPVS